MFMWSFGALQIAAHFGKSQAWEAGSESPTSCLRQRLTSRSSVRPTRLLSDIASFLLYHIDNVILNYVAHM